MTINPKLLIIFKSSGLCEVEPDLGEKIVKNFFNALLDSGECPARMIFMGSGIFLTTDGSPAIDELRKFDAAGTKIASCGTCLEYYKRTDKLLVGSVGNMKDTVSAMLSFEKVIQF